MAGYALGFAMGATSVIRFSFYREFLSRRGRSNNHRQPGPYSSHARGLEPPPFKLRRSGEGGPGPTTPKPDIIPKPQFPLPRIIREDFLP